MGSMLSAGPSAVMTKALLVFLPDDSTFVSCKMFVWVWLEGWGGLLFSTELKGLTDVFHSKHLKG